MIVSRKFDSQSGEKISRRPWPSVFWKWDSSIAATRDTFRRLSCSYLLLLLCAPQTRAWLFTFQLHIFVYSYLGSSGCWGGCHDYRLFVLPLPRVLMSVFYGLFDLCIAITSKRLYTTTTVLWRWYWGRLLTASDVCRYSNEYRGEI